MDMLPINKILSTHKKKIKPLRIERIRRTKGSGLVMTSLAKFIVSLSIMWQKYCDDMEL